MTTTTNRLEQLIGLLEEVRDDHDKFFDARVTGASTYHNNNIIKEKNE